MKNRPFLVFFIVIVLSIVALIFAWRHTTSAKSRPEIAIQDGKTIDFSAGRPVVKDTAKDKAVLEKAVKDMQEATKSVTFPPSSTKAAEPKKSETKQ